MKVHRELGPIHKEVVYQKALEESMIKEGLEVDREARSQVRYQNKVVGTYIPDFIINHEVLVEIKALEYLPEKSEVQLSYYLMATGFKIGLLLNFGTRKLQIKRRING